MKANWKKLCKKQREEIAYLRECVNRALELAWIAGPRIDDQAESQSKSYATERDRKEEQDEQIH